MSLQWTTIGDKITDRFIPKWAQDLPDYVAKLQREMNMARGSLAEEVWQEAQDEDIHPELALNARVRVGRHLCRDEMAFVRRRKMYTSRALANYLEIPEADVDPRDVPTIAVCGSGGGLRALVAGAASYLSVGKNPLGACSQLLIIARRRKQGSLIAQLTRKWFRISISPLEF